MKKFTYIGTYGLLINQHRVLLTTKKKGPYTGLLDLVGGGIEFAEEVQVALKREFLEEVAMDVSGFEWLGNFTAHGHTYEVDGDPAEFFHIGLVYIVSEFKEVKGAIAEDEFGWYAIDELKAEKLTPFAIKALEKIL